MAEPTITSVFGTSATQSATTLTISKTDLATIGLTASASNTPESLLAAIVAFAQLTLTETNFDANLDQSIVISNSTDVLIVRNNVTYRQTTKAVEFYKVDTSGSFDPDNY